MSEEIKTDDRESGTPEPPRFKVGDRVWVNAAQDFQGFGELREVDAKAGRARVQTEAGGLWGVPIGRVVPLLTPGDTCDRPPHPGEYENQYGGHSAWTADGVSRGVAVFPPYTYLGPLDAEDDQPDDITGGSLRRLLPFVGPGAKRVVGAGADALDQIAAIREALGLDAEDDVAGAVRAMELTAQALADKLDRATADLHNVLAGDDRWTKDEIARALRGMADETDGDACMTLQGAALSFALGEVTRG